MPPTDRPDQEPDTPAGSALVPVSKSRMSLTRVRRELTDDELGSPAVQKMLIDEIERLERESSELADFRDRFYDADKRAAIILEREKKSISGEVIFGVCLSVGAAAVGYAPAVWSTPPQGPIALVFGAVLMIGGIVSRLVKR